MKNTRHTTAAFLLAVFLFGCEDQGGPVTPSSTGTSAAVKFSTDILPLFGTKGCTGCHGANGGLSVTSVASLLTGGNHGPAIVPGNADSSIIIKKLRPSPPFGSRMPADGNYLSAAEIKIIEDWINAGAKND